MLGDIVQFTRFAQGIVARGKRPVFEVLQSLAPLIAQADNVRRVMREGKAFPETGLHIPVFDLLSIFAGHLRGVMRSISSPVRTTPSGGRTEF